MLMPNMIKIATVSITKVFTLKRSPCHHDAPRPFVEKPARKQATVWVLFCGRKTQNWQVLQNIARCGPTDTGFLAAPWPLSAKNLNVLSLPHRRVYAGLMLPRPSRFVKLARGGLP
jgi:hypothetical protein